jgi:flagellar biosynthesis protein FlhF
MRIRQFMAPSTGEALRVLRETLGDEALVLSTRSQGGGVVITAAVDDPPEAPAEASDATARPHLGGAEVRFDLALIRTQLEHLGRKVHRMDRALRAREEGADALGPEARQVAEQLLGGGFAWHLAEPVAASFERAVAGARSHADALAGSLLEHVEVAPEPPARIEALVGASGAGKTTTIAKLAARAVLAGERPPGLVAADNVRVGAVEELAIYARLLGAPLRIVRDPADMRDAIADLADCDRVLVDTAGLCGDPASGPEVHALLAAAGAEVGVTAVISASTALSALQRGWQQLAGLEPRRCVVTRLDECDEPGIACTWLAEVGLPLAWLGTGRRVPDDLVAACGDELARWLVAA